MREEMIEILSSICVAFAVMLFLVSSTAMVGCNDREKVLDVETQNSEMEVYQDEETGETIIETEEE